MRGWRRTFAVLLLLPAVASAQVTTGSPFGGSGGGASSGTFLDTVFTLQDNVDPTKQAQFQLSGISTGTTRTFNFQNSASALTLASLEFPNTWTQANGFSSVSVGGTFRFNTKTTTTVDAATTFAASTSAYVVLQCTGVESINTITGGSTGMILYLENSDSECTLVDDDAPTAADAMNLTGTATNDVGSTAKMLTFIHDGNAWQQTGESANN